MDIELVPSPREKEEVRAALVELLERCEMGRNDSPQQYRSAWRRVGLEEAVDEDPARYARSPRSTPGATRA